MYFVLRKWFGDLKRNIAVSTVVIMFMLHPTLIKAGLSVFQCIEVDNEDYRVKVDLDMDCYSLDHFKWVLLFGLPMLLIYGIGVPITGLIILIKYRKHIDEWSLKKYMLVLYQGLKLNRFYWEFVNTFRKILLL